MMTKPADIHVGMMVRSLRKERGMSQQGLADCIGLTFQQVQKYERGANRISASTLFDIATALQVEVSWFFGGLEPKTVRGDNPTFVGWAISDTGMAWMRAGELLNARQLKNMLHIAETLIDG